MDGNEEEKKMAKETLPKKKNCLLKNRQQNELLKGKGHEKEEGE